MDYKPQSDNTFKYENVTTNSVNDMITGLVLGTLYTKCMCYGVNAFGTGDYCCAKTPVINSEKIQWLIPF